MWNFIATSATDRPITVGGTCWPSMLSRAGGESAATSSVPLPLVGQPLLVVGGGDPTTAVGTDVDEFDPSVFLAVTWTRSVLPASTDFRTYVLSVAPLIDEQLPPFSSHRRQSYVNEIGVAPFHLPGSAVSVWPTVAVPVIVGGDWLVGGLAACERPVTTSAATA